MTDMKALVSEAQNIFVLTGAGVSTEAGIPDFQTSDENWTHVISRQEAISRPFFNQNPVKFWEIYRDTFHSKMVSQEPTTFHKWLAELEKTKTVHITTQNVDGLHTLAGNTSVVEAHGNVTYAICTRQSCGERYLTEWFKDTVLPRCLVCNKVLKPDVSLFYEGITGFMESMDNISTSDLVIVAGTSLEVGPINELPMQAELRYRKPLLWVNKQLAPPAYNFDYEFIGSMGDFVQEVS